MQDRYKQWKKSSVMNFQKVGDREVVSNTSKAVASFKNRMNKKHISDAIKIKKENSNKGAPQRSSRGESESSKKEGFFKGRKVTSELKNSKQIAKAKVQKRNLSSTSGRGGFGGKGGRGGKGGKPDRKKGQGGRSGSGGKGKQ